MWYVLDKKLKGISDVRPDNRMVFCAQGPNTKHFECVFYRSISFNILIEYINLLIKLVFKQFFSKVRF